VSTQPLLGTPLLTGYTNDEILASWIIKIKNFFGLKIILLSRVSKNKNKYEYIFKYNITNGGLFLQYCSNAKNNVQKYNQNIY